jgi:hypothetical protein
MARYNAGTGQGGTPQAMSTSYKTLVGLTCPSTVRRAWIYDLMAGADGAVADNSMAFIVDRQTTVGTGTGITPRPLDAADGATTIVGTVNHTAEPTVTADTDLLEIGGNQRASFRWVASPGGELVIPATNLNGVGLRAKSPAPSSYTGTMIAIVQFWD